MGADLQGRIGNDIGDFADLIVRRANAARAAPRHAPSGLSRQSPLPSQAQPHVGFRKEGEE
jgi:hypothetical protein